MTGLVDAPTYAQVTERPGRELSVEQIRMIVTRYRLAAQHAAGRDVLEVACGPGTGARFLAACGARVVAGDIDAALVREAVSVCGSQGSVVLLDGHALPFEAHSFDTVVFFEAIYYLERPEAFLAEVRRVLRPDGTLVLCTANREQPRFAPSAWSRMYFSAAELRALLQGHGFDVEMFGAFPTTPPGAFSRVKRAFATSVRKHRLVPPLPALVRRGRQLLFGELVRYDDNLNAIDLPSAPFTPLQPGDDAAPFQVLYAIARTSRQ